MNKKPKVGEYVYVEAIDSAATWRDSREPAKDVRLAIRGVRGQVERVDRNVLVLHTGGTLGDDQYPASHERHVIWPKAITKVTVLATTHQQERKQMAKKKKKPKPPKRMPMHPN